MSCRRMPSGKRQSAASGEKQSCAKTLHSAATPGAPLQFDAAPAVPTTNAMESCFAARPGRVHLIYLTEILVTSYNLSQVFRVFMYVSALTKGANISFRYGMSSFSSTCMAPC